MDRQQQLERWLREVRQQASFTLTTASADASFRRYFRVHLAGETLIAMDAPPPQEDCRPFVRIAQLFSDAGVNVPQVIAQDVERGFLLLSDLGDDTYLSRLNLCQRGLAELDHEGAASLYRDATATLVTLQLASQPNVLPSYDEALLTREMQLFADWYIGQHLNINLSQAQREQLQAIFQMINKNVFAQGQVYVHRDYHSRNLMVTSQKNPGVLDFQDAVYGAITYDLVSLLKDAYIQWDEALMIDWAVRYWEQARKVGLPVPADFGQFYRDFEWMGVQRHLKVLGIFARLYHRDGKADYLKDMPLVMDYLRKACERYVQLRPLLRLLDTLEGREQRPKYVV